MRRQRRDAPPYDAKCFWQAGANDILTSKKAVRRQTDVQGRSSRCQKHLSNSNAQRSQTVLAGQTLNDVARRSFSMRFRQ